MHGDSDQVDSSSTVGESVRGQHPATTLACLNMTAGNHPEDHAHVAGEKISPEKVVKEVAPVEKGKLLSLPPVK